MSVHYNSPCESYVFLPHFATDFAALKIARLTKHDFLSMFVSIHALKEIEKCALDTEF